MKSVTDPRETAKLPHFPSNKRSANWTFWLMRAVLLTFFVGIVVSPPAMAKQQKELTTAQKAELKHLEKEAQNLQKELDKMVAKEKAEKVKQLEKEALKLQKELDKMVAKEKAEKEKAAAEKAKKESSSNRGSSKSGGSPSNSTSPTSNAIPLPPIFSQPKDVIGFIRDDTAGGTPRVGFEYGFLTPDTGLSDFINGLDPLFEAERWGAAVVAKTAAEKVFGLAAGLPAYVFLQLTFPKVLDEGEVPFYGEEIRSYDLQSLGEEYTPELEESVVLKLRKGGFGELLAGEGTSSGFQYKIAPVGSIRGITPVALQPVLDAAPVPLPPALGLFGAGLMGLVALRRSSPT